MHVSIFESSFRDNGGFAVRGAIVRILHSAQQRLGPFHITRYDHAWRILLWRYLAHRQVTSHRPPVHERTALQNQCIPSFLR